MMAIINVDSNNISSFVFLYSCQKMVPSNLFINFWTFVLMIKWLFDKKALWLLGWMESLKTNFQISIHKQKLL